MASSTDPLTRLLADEAQVNRELLAGLLEDKVRLDRSGTFMFKRGVRDQLGSSKVVLTALLAQKALSLLGADVHEQLLPRELEAVTGIKGGTLRPILKKLVDANTIRRGDNGYFVPGYAIEDIAHLVSENE